MAKPSDEVAYAIQTAARKSGVPYSALLAIAERESTFNPKANNADTSAAGLFQFIDGTWAREVSRHGATYGLTRETADRYNPLHSAYMAAEYAKENSAYLKKQLGRDVRPGEMYVAHFMGGGGASKLIRAAEADPDADASKLFPAQAAANPTIFNGKSIGQVYNDLMTTVEGSGIAQYQVSGNYTPNQSSYQDEQQQPDHSIGEGIASAWEETPTSWLLSRSGYEVDENFTVSPERIKEDMKELNLPTGEGYGERLGSAMSEKHYEDIKQRLQKMQQSRQTLSEMGFTGTALGVGMQLIDPVTLAAEAATGGAVAFAVGGARASRAANALRISGVGAATAAGGELAAGAVAPERGRIGDVTMAGLTGAALGGVAGALSRRAATSAEASVVARNGRKTAEGDVPQERMSPNVMGENNANRSIGAAEVPDDGDLLPEALSDLYDADVEKSWGWRFDTIGRLKKSKNAVSRLFFGQLAKDGVGGADGVVAKTAVSETKSMIKDEMTSSFYRTHGNALSDWKKLNPNGNRAEFNEQWYEYVTDRRINAEQFYDDAVVRMGNKVRNLYEEYGKLANNPFYREGGIGRAIKGFEDWKANKFYMMRRWSDEKIVKAIHENGEGAVTKLIAKSMIRANPSLEYVNPDQVARFAKGFTQAIRKRALHINEGTPMNISMENIDIAREEFLAMAEKVDELDPKDINAIFDNMKPKNTDAGNNPRGKHRAMLDEHTRLEPDEVITPYGTGMDKPLRLMDLLETDGEELFHSYSDQMAGSVAFARMRVVNPRTGEMLVDGITSQSDWDRVIDNIRKYADSHGISTKQTEREIKSANKLRNIILNHNTADMSDQTLQYLRLFKKASYARVMNQAGFAQISEASSTISTLGLKAAFSHMPAFRRILNYNGEEVLQNGLARDVEEFMMAGVERLNRDEWVRRDGISIDGVADGSGRFLNKAERMLDKASHITGDISGMNVANMALQRWTGMASLQKLVNIANKGGKMSKSFAQRMRDVGISDKMSERIFKQLTDENVVQTETGHLTGRKIKRFNYDRMTDLEAKVALQEGMYRLNRRIIQQNDPGMIMTWMSHPVGGLFMQFRSFVTAAYTNNLLYNTRRLANGDPGALAYFILSTVMAGTVYAVQEQIRAIGREDRDEYLERRLSWDSLARAAFSRSSYSSIIPMLADTGPSQILAGEPLFDYRTSEQAATAILGTPAASTFEQTVKALSGPVSAIKDGRGMSQKEVRDIRSALLWGNALPVVIATDALIQGLDARPPRKY